MAAKKSRNILNPDVLFAFGIGGVLFVLLFPLPQIVLSILLVFSISISLVILIMMFYLRKSLEISSFPTILLILTLLRLSLNVASTKLILLYGNAGSVIDAFGRFAVGNNYIVGGVVFIILVIINFMVIVKGSGRIAEVTARFTLDGMPGKQMSIDADLNSGIIDEEEAKAKRQELSDEAEFFGAMDGASKFITGDAMAGIIITCINVLGGIAIGILQQGLPIVEALQKYTVLTIGDGLVSQIPALLISVAAGILVSKTESEKGGTGTQLGSELIKRHQPLLISSVMLTILAVLPGFPFIPFSVLALVTFFGGMYAYRRNMAKEEEDELLAAAGHVGALPAGAGAVPGLPAPADGDGNLLENPDVALPKVNPMTLEVGFSLVPLVDPNQEGDLVDRISLIRKQIKDEMGFLIPPISIQDNIDLANNEYRILVRGLERARGNIHPTSHLAINPGDVTSNIEGIKTIDPAFGFEATWISSSRVETAENMGYTVVDGPSVITTHVTKVVKDYAAELISRQDISDMLEQVKESNEAVVNELIPGLLPVGVVHRVLQYLLDEKVPIHDLPRILETLSDYAPQTRDPIILCEFARQALKGHIVSRHLGEDRTMYAITLDPMLEDEIQNSIGQGSGGGIMSLPPERAVDITDAVRVVYENALEMAEADVVLLVSPLIRLHMFRMIERKIDDLSVLSYSEVSDDIPLQILNTVKLNNQESMAA
jgi:flagellar biosynthesis protein FlhA